MKDKKTKRAASDFQTLSLFLILGLLTLAFVLGVHWVFLTPARVPTGTSIQATK